MCNRDKYFAHRAERLKKMAADFSLATTEKEIGFSSMCAAAQAAGRAAGTA